MAKGSKHLKRLAAPKSWAVSRKGKVWLPKPTPGKHSVEDSIPLLVAMRDYLHICDTRNEARRILGQKDILVDGVPTRNEKMPIGLMDVVTIPKLKAYYRVLFDKRGKVRLMPIPKDQTVWKLVRVNNKTKVKGGKVQLNLHDGRNIIVDKDDYNTGDTLKLAIPEQKVLGKFEFEEGHMAYLTGGSHVGHLASISKIERTRNPKANIVHFKEEFTTHQDYVFVVGADVPEIDVPEVVT